MLAKREKLRIMQSIKRPVLEVIKSVRSSEPEASPKNHLVPLNTAFGSAESTEDVYFSFKLLQQISGEKLSDFFATIREIADQGGTDG